MTTPNTPNAAERPRRVLWLSRLDVEEMENDGSRSAQIDAYRECGDWEPGYLCFQEIDSHRPAESVSAEPVAWMVTRDNDPSFPRIYTTEAAADAMCKFCNVAPTVRKAPLYLHPQPSTPSADDLKIVDEVIRLLESPAVMPSPLGGINWAPEHYFSLLHDFKKVRERLAAPPAQAVSVPDGIAKLANERQPSPHTSHSVSLDVVGGLGCKASVEVTAPAAATREGKE